MKRLWPVLVLLVACAHAGPPRATTFGKKVGLGEMVGAPDVIEPLRDALGEVFDLTQPNPELHLHVDAATGGFDEAVLQPRAGEVVGQQRLVRRVQTLRATIRLVEDATGEVRALGVYDLVEKGPDRPIDARPNDDLAIILARRVVRSFVESNQL
ncbi:MAG: hypothetical protein IPJ65_00825 [Archangiaceae bacterium]|nr:hypothetical protein [Archangiaceae bacterium]